MPASKTAAEPTTAVSKNSEMVEAEQAMNGTKNIDGEEAERGGRGVKRPAEEEARGGQDADAGSLRIAPSAKRHKTDAEWGMSLRPHQPLECTCAQAKCFMCFCWHAAQRANMQCRCSSTEWLTWL